MIASHIRRITDCFLSASLLILGLLLSLLAFVASLLLADLVYLLLRGIA